jgi:hypothetical protein
MTVEIKISDADNNRIADELMRLAEIARGGSLSTFGSGGGGRPSVSVVVTK